MAQQDRASTATPKSIRRREKIIESAIALFDRHGYANTSLDDIAKEVGIKREGIYYYFKNRAEILLSIILPQSEALIEGMREVMATDRPPVEKLHLAVRNHLERFDVHCLEMTVSLRDGYFEDAAEVRDVMNRIWKDYERMWTTLIADGQASGAFRDCGDPKMLAFGMLGMCNWLARWYDPGKSVSIPTLIDSYFDMLAFGLAAERGGGRR
jgi:AcrR family transcriptional regulator